MDVIPNETAIINKNHNNINKVIWSCKIHCRKKSYDFVLIEEEKLYLDFCSILYVVSF